MFRLTTEIVLFMYAMVFTIYTSVLPQLVLEKVCLHKYENATICSNLSDNTLEQAHVQKTTTWWMMIFFICSYVPSFFTIMILGPVSDIVGRKKALVFVTMLFLLQSIIYFCNSYFMSAIPAYLMIGAILSSLYGNVQGVVMLSYSYMADITTGIISHRTMRMALVEFSLFFSGAPAGIASGSLFITFYWVSSSIYLCSCLYICSFVIRVFSIACHIAKL